MATLRQKKAVEKLVEASRNPNMIKKTKGEILLESGYSIATAIKPTQVTKSVGFKKELENYGLTEGLVTRALVNDIKAKPRKRFFELSLGADILGMKKRDGQPNNQVNIVIIPYNLVGKYDLRTSPSPTEDSR